MNEERWTKISSRWEETTEETMAEEARKLEPVDIERKSLNSKTDTREVLRLTTIASVVRDLIEAGIVRCSTIEDFLTVYDTFSMGLTAIKTATGVATIQEGMEMVWAGFQRVWKV